MTRKQLRELTKWMSAINYAYSMGDITYDDLSECFIYTAPGLYATGLWCRAYDSTLDVEVANAMVRALAKGLGVDLKKHRSGRIG